MAAKKLKKNESIIDLAQKRFRLAVEAERENRQISLEDLEFAAGDQWPEEIRRDREINHRPCITINRLPQFIRQITNDQRQNRPSIQISPVDDKADIETAKVLQGMIRNIEYDSNADIAYDRAFDSAVRCGIGYFRVTTDFVSPDSFDQQIVIKSIKNRFNVYLDPSYQEPDGSDANWGFIFEDISNEDYDEYYPDSEMCGLDNWRSIGDSAEDWATESTRRVAEYFYKDFEKKTIYQLSSGEIVLKKDLPEGILTKKELEDYPQELWPEVYIEKSRETMVPMVYWCKINGIEELERTEWPGKWVPIIPVIGDELDVDGKRILEGVVRHAKDSQKMLNFWVSKETEAITLAPNAPFIGVAGQFEGHESKWESANRLNHAYLEYEQVTINGQLAPPPQRNTFEPAVQAITNARLQAADDLKNTTGIYDAALGARSNENSGIAIQRRNLQSQTSNFHFVDNLSRSQRHLGRILVDLIPKIYDTPRIARIIGEDDEQEIVQVNQPFKKGNKEVLHDLNVGKYDVAVSTGPSYQTKRQEAVESMLALTKAMPNTAALISDLLVKNMDWPGAQEIAERLKRTVPPEILGNEEGEEIPQAAQAQMQQMNQMIEQLTQQLNEKSEVIGQEQLKYEHERYKIDKDAELKLAKIESDMRIALLKEEGQDSRMAFEQEIYQLDRKQDLETKKAAGEQSAMAAQNINLTGGISPGQPVE